LPVRSSVPPECCGTPGSCRSARARWRTAAVMINRSGAGCGAARQRADQSAEYAPRITMPRMHCARPPHNAVRRHRSIASSRGTREVPKSWANIVNSPVNVCPPRRPTCVAPERKSPRNIAQPVSPRSDHHKNRNQVHSMRGNHVAGVATRDRRQRQRCTTCGGSVSQPPPSAL